MELAVWVHLRPAGALPLNSWELWVLHESQHENLQLLCHRNQMTGPAGKAPRPRRLPLQSAVLGLLPQHHIKSPFNSRDRVPDASLSTALTNHFLWSCLSRKIFFHLKWWVCMCGYVCIEECAGHVFFSWAVWCCSGSASLHSPLKSITCLPSFMLDSCHLGSSP